MGVIGDIYVIENDLHTLQYLIQKASAKNKTKKEIQALLDEMCLIIEEDIKKIGLQ